MTAAKKSDKPKEATALLRADHKAVSALFTAYEKTRSPAKKCRSYRKYAPSSASTRR